MKTKKIIIAALFVILAVLSFISAVFSEGIEYGDAHANAGTMRAEQLAARSLKMVKPAEPLFTEAHNNADVMKAEQLAARKLAVGGAELNELFGDAYENAETMRAEQLAARSLTMVEPDEPSFADAHSSADTMRKEQMEVRRLIDSNDHCGSAYSNPAADQLCGIE